MSNSFIFYRGFADTIKLAPREDRLQLFEYLCSCALGDIEIDDVPYPMNMTVKSMLASVEASRHRYEKAVERGKKGGRPKIWVDREEAEKLYAESNSWKYVAEKLGVSQDKLYRCRMAWKYRDKEEKEHRGEQQKEYDPTVDWSKSED